VTGAGGQSRAAAVEVTTLGRLHYGVKTELSGLPGTEEEVLKEGDASGLRTFFIES
jgi:hypothetical protein